VLQFVSPSEAATKEEVTRLIGRDRVNMIARKGKGKEGSSSQSRSSYSIGGIMSTLKKLGTSFTMVPMWKQYNKFYETNTADMDAEELMSHQKTLRLIKKDLNFVTQNVMEVQDKDDE
jgi:hypothetical protein